MIKVAETAHATAHESSQSALGRGVETIAPTPGRRFGSGTADARSDPSDCEAEGAEGDVWVGVAVWVAVTVIP